MSSDFSEQQRSIRDQVEQSERALGDLDTELKSVEAELEALIEKGQQYDVLSQICRGLDELDELGANKLFWDENAGAGARDERLRFARQKIDDFNAEIARVESRREAIIADMGSQNTRLDELHYSLKDSIAREESRRNEWLVEREPNVLPHRAQVMPWTRGCEEDQRFRKSLGSSFAASIAVAFLVSTIAIPVVERERVVELPERVAKLVRQERRPPPPVEPPVIPEKLPEPEPELVKEQPPEPTPRATEAPVVAEVPQPDTREQVKAKGILAFRESFAGRASQRPSAQLGSQARVTSAGENAVGRPQRMMVTTSAPGSSGGINLADISRDVGGGGGGGIAGVEVSRVASTIGGAEGPDRPLSGGAPAGRTDEEIQIVFDRYKAALYRLYNRELRKDPTLRGQLVLKLTIEPNGSVSLCQLQSSDMNAPVLAQQVVDRVRTFDFGAKEDIVAVTIIYPIDFLPAA